MFIICFEQTKLLLTRSNTDATRKNVFVEFSKHSCEVQGIPKKGPDKDKKTKQFQIRQLGSVEQKPTWYLPLS